MSELNFPPSAWWWHPEIDPATLGQFLDDNKGRLISLTSHIRNGQRKFAAFWVKNEGVAWWWNPDVDPATLGQLIDNNKGRLISLDVYMVNGQMRCAAVWVENKGTAWWWNPDVDPANLGEMLEDNKGRLISLRSYMKGTQRRYAAVWVENKGTAWWWHPNVDLDTLGIFLSNNQGRLISLDTFVENGQRRFAGVWVKNQGQTWWWNAGMQPPELGAEFDLFCTYPMDLVAYEEGGVLRTASVRYQYSLLKVANGISGLSITATADLKTMQNNGDQLNRIQLTLQNTGSTLITLEDMNVSPIASGGYMTYWWDPYMAFPSWAATGGLLNPGQTMSATIELGSPGDRSHFLVQARSKNASGDYLYHSETVPIVVPSANTPPAISAEPPVMLALWTKPAEIYPVWHNGGETHWMTVAGQLINIGGSDLRIAGIGMRLQWGGQTVVEKQFDPNFYNWSDADSWWKKLDLDSDKTLKGSNPWAHFLHGIEVDLPSNGIAGHLHVWLNYKIDGQCGTATWDSDVVYTNARTLQVPVAGTWRWGNSGDHAGWNGHTWPAHRFDIDLTIVGANGKTFDDDNGNLAFKDAPNTAFYAWDQPVYATRKGTVVDTDQSNPDNNGNTPISDPLPPANFVLVQHSDGSVAAYYHFKENGVEVSNGDNIEQGDLLGYVGNSGGSSEPHLHLGYLVPRDTGFVTTIPMQFSGLFTADAKSEVKGHPGTNIYQSVQFNAAQETKSGCLPLGFLKKKSEPVVERPQPTRLTAAQLESLRRPVICHCNFADHFGEMTQEGRSSR